MSLTCLAEVLFRVIRFKTWDTAPMVSMANTIVCGVLIKVLRGRVRRATFETLMSRVDGAEVWNYR